MEWITQNFEWIIVAVSALFSAGIVRAVKKAVKESKEAFKQGELIYEKIKVYRKDGFTIDEIKSMFPDFEKFYKEGKEAYEAIDSVWKMIKKSIKKK